MTRHAGFPRGLFVASRRDDPSGGLSRWEQLGGGWSRVGSAPAIQLAALAAHPTLPLVYGVAAVGETGSRLHCWRVDDREPVHVADVEGFGADPCHVSIDPTGGLLVVTNYASSDLTVQRLDDAGSFTGGASLFPLSGHSIDPDRQDRPHPHQSVYVNGRLVVVDLGTDELRGFEVDPATNSGAALREIWRNPVPAGSGPRHLAVLRDSRVALSGELASSALVGRLDDRGRTDWAAAPSTARTGPAQTRHERNYPGDIQASPDGRFVYLANRGYDTIATFAVDGPVPRLVAEQDARVAWPQHMTVFGDDVIVCGWDSSRVVRLACENGIAGESQPLFECPDPVWILAAS